MSYLRTKELVDKYFYEGNDVDIWDYEMTEAYHKEAMWSVINHLKNNNLHYKEALADCNWNSIEEVEYEKIPFLTKEELRKDPWMLLSVPKKEISLIHVSTGTTGGKPIYMAHTLPDLYDFDLAPRYKALFNHYCTEDVAFVALPYEMSSAGLSFHKVFQFQERTIVAPVGKGGFYSVPEKTLDMMLDLGATILITTPSYAILLAECAKEKGFNVKDKIKLKAFWLTGEGASDALRKRIEKLWGCKATTFYGTLECGSVGMECDRQNGYHLSSAHVVVDIVDPDTGKKLEPGEIGEIVITTLLHEGMPMLKYKTQDIGYIDDTPCSCGCKAPRLFLRGRLVDQFVIDGKEYSPFYIEEHLMRNPEVGNWYKFVPRDAYLEIQVEPGEGITGNEEVADKIAGKIEFATGAPCKLVFVEHIDKSLGKNVRVVRKEIR